MSTMGIVGGAEPVDTMGRGLWIDGVEYLDEPVAAENIDVTVGCVRKWAARGFIDVHTVREGRAVRRYYPAQKLLTVDRDRRRAGRGRPRRAVDRPAA